MGPGSPGSWVLSSAGRGVEAGGVQAGGSESLDPWVPLAWDVEWGLVIRAVGVGPRAVSAAVSNPPHPPKAFQVLGLTALGVGAGLAAGLRLSFIHDHLLELAGAATLVSFGLSLLLYLKALLASEAALAPGGNSGESGGVLGRLEGTLV